MRVQPAMGIRFKGGCGQIAATRPEKKRGVGPQQQGTQKKCTFGSARGKWERQANESPTFNFESFHLRRGGNKRGILNTSFEVVALLEGEDQPDENRG